MSNQNYVNYQVALLPENAKLIDQLNKLLITGAATDSKSADTVREEVSSTAVSTLLSILTTVTLEQVKAAAKASKKTHGEEFTMQVLKDNGVKVAATLGRSMSAIDESKYDSVIEAWGAGPQVSEEPEDDGFGDDDDGDFADISAEAVQDALKAYSKDVGRAEAKEIMNKHGAKTLSNVPDCTAKQLAAMMADLIV